MMIIDAAFIRRNFAINSTAALVYIYLRNVSLSSLKRGKPYTYCGRQRIADELGVSLRTAQRAVKVLQDVGLIVVQRIGCHCNDHIYVQDALALAGTSVISCSDKVSHQNILLSETKDNTSISPAKKQDDDEKMVLPRQVHMDAIVKKVEVKKQEVEKGCTQPKGVPTPKRPRMSKHSKQMRKFEIKQRLQRQLRLSEAAEYHNEDELDRINNAIDIVADACAGSGNLCVRGRYIATCDYLRVMGRLRLDVVIDVLDRMGWVSADVGIRNPRGYLLSALYTEAEMLSLTA